MDLIKQIASRLPDRLQEELQRWSYRRRIRLGKFGHYEPEFAQLDRWVESGDVVLDIGANVGIFTMRLSELVGSTGRVFAFEPVNRTFSLLTSNVRCSQFDNVTLINAAASDAARYVALSAPKLESGLVAYPQAAIQGTGDGGYQAFAFPVDQLNIPPRVALVKLDVEGHELFALQGMPELLQRDQPKIILEGDDPDVVEFLETFGYRATKLTESSPNTVFDARS